MGDQFQNLIRQRQKKLAWVLLGLFCFAMLTIDRFAYRVIGFPDGRIMEFISFSMIGLIAAQFALLAIWTALGEGSLLRRLLFLVCALATITSAWMLGLVSSFGGQSVALHRREEILFAGIVPTLFLALCMPLIALRRFFSRMLSVTDEPTREPLTTFGLMIFTAVVAICLASAQLPQWIGTRPSDLWMAIGVYSGASFFLGLAVMLPTVLLLFSKRRNVYLWSGLLIGFAELLTLLSVGAILLLPKSPIRRGDIWPAIIVPSQIVGTAMLAVIVGIAIMRLFGYRLQTAK